MSETLFAELRIADDPENRATVIWLLGRIFRIAIPDFCDNGKELSKSLDEIESKGYSIISVLNETCRDEFGTTYRVITRRGVG